MLLDEPTNNPDQVNIECLEKIAREFRVARVVVSYEAFLRRGGVTISLLILSVDSANLGCDMSRKDCGRARAYGSS